MSLRSAPCYSCKAPWVAASCRTGSYHRYDRQMSSSSRQIVFALLAVTGLIVTWYFNLQFISASGGFSLTEFIAATHVNAAASSISYDLLVVVVVFLFWSWTEARRLQMRHWWVLIPLTFGIAIAFAFPLFMLLRERAIETNGQQQSP